MDASLDLIPIRVLGCLIEKQITTPEYYPLTLNALVNACNQTTNRDPVTSYSEETVDRVLENLRHDGWVWKFTGGRAAKYEHRFGEKFQLSPAETAVMCVLMLRGAQTPGEIRGRTSRLHEFASIGDVEATLDALASREPALVAKQPRLPGTKESRFAHRLGTDAPAAAGEDVAAPIARTPVTAGVAVGEERIAKLEGEVEALRAEIEDLRRQLQELHSTQ